jgi:hypothetical protein
VKDRLFHHSDFKTFQLKMTKEVRAADEGALKKVSIILTHYEHMFKLVQLITL